MNAMVPVLRPPVKHRSAESVPLSPNACSACGGAGRIGDDWPCEACDSTGRVKVVEGYRRYEAARYCTYHAVSGLGEFPIDSGVSLVPFVEQLQRDWPESLHDLAVWREEGPDDPIRLVAVLRPKAGGGLSVQYL